MFHLITSSFLICKSIWKNNNCFFKKFYVILIMRIIKFWIFSKRKRTWRTSIYISLAKISAFSSLFSYPCDSNIVLILDTLGSIIAFLSTINVKWQRNRVRVEGFALRKRTFRLYWFWLWLLHGVHVRVIRFHFAQDGSNQEKSIFLTR